MTLDLSKPVQTRDGRKVRILCTDAKTEYTIVGLYEYCDGTEIHSAWLKDGSFYPNKKAANLDLINVPEKSIPLFKDENIQKAYELLDAHLKKANIDIWDLFKPLKAEQEPKSITGWINVYIEPDDSDGTYTIYKTNGIFETKTDADNSESWRDGKRVACFSVNTTEGEGFEMKCKNCGKPIKKLRSLCGSIYWGHSKTKCVSCETHVAEPVSKEGKKC